MILSTLYHAISYIFYEGPSFYGLHSFRWSSCLSLKDVYQFFASHSSGLSFSGVCLTSCSLCLLFLFYLSCFLRFLLYLAEADVSSSQAGAELPYSSQQFFLRNGLRSDVKGYEIFAFATAPPSSRFSLLSYWTTLINLVYCSLSCMHLALTFQNICRMFICSMISYQKYTNLLPLQLLSMAVAWDSSCDVTMTLSVRKAAWFSSVKVPAKAVRWSPHHGGYAFYGDGHVEQVSLRLTARVRFVPLISPQSPSLPSLLCLHWL